MNELSSLWDGLNPHLIASFWEVDRQGKSVGGDGTVKAPLTEASMDMTLNWQSAFENASLDQKAPAIMAMLQAGFVTQLTSAIGQNGNQGGVVAGAANSISDTFKSFEGRTSITKLNSTQIFTGMPPVKFQVTALFRAWRDAQWEVEDPFNQLMSWALPKELSEDGMMGKSLKAVTGSGTSSAIEFLLPSLAPSLIAMKYKGRTFAPLVIEAISQPLGSPIDSSGKFVQLLVPMTICSLTAIDRDDWRGFQPV